MNEQTLTAYLLSNGWNKEVHELSGDPCLGNTYYQVILFDKHFTISFSGNDLDFSYPKTEAEAMAIFSNLLFKPTATT